MDALASIITDEHGKVFSDAKGEVQRGIEVVEFACGAPQLLKTQFSDNIGGGIDNYSLRQPLGVVAGITPFNFPAMVPMWMFPLALVCGNTFVLKPSERDPSASLLLAELLQQAGLPDGAFNVVQGDKEAVDAILAHRRHRRGQLRRLDADCGVHPRRRHAARQARAGARRRKESHGRDAGRRPRSGGRCVGGCGLRIGRRALHGGFGVRCSRRRRRRVDRQIEIAHRHACASPAAWRRDADMGPLVTAAHRDKVLGYIDQGVADGATHRVRRAHASNRAHASAGFFLGATLFDRVEPSMRIYREEIFGPVLRHHARARSRRRA